MNLHRKLCRLDLAEFCITHLKIRLPTKLSAPILLFREGQEPRAYSLENVSKQEIVSVTMGCATMNGHKPEILREFASQVCVA